MKIFDVHVHVEKGMRKYDLKAEGINVIFNSLDDYRRSRNAWATPQNAVTLLFDFRDGWDFVRAELRQKRAHAVKIHSRIQKIKSGDYQNIERKLAVVNPSLPIIVDAFYYGAELDLQPNLAAIIRLAKRFPERRLVVAHAGGHHVLDYFFHLRELNNIYYDLSASLHYLADSSAYLDLKKLIRFTDKSRILFGSDFPYAPARAQEQKLLRILKECRASAAETRNIFHGNARALFWPKNVRVS